MTSHKTSDHAITGLRTHTVDIPAKAVHSHGSGDVGSIRSVLLEVTTASGLTGWGEASPWPVFTGTAEAAVAALHTHLRPGLLGGDPVQVQAHMAQADRTLVGHPEAKAALECALMDLTGQISGLSIAELLGGRQRDTIPLSFSVANPDFDADLDDIARLFADGVRLFKLKTGFNAHGFDVMRLERLRAKYGDALDLRIDYNQGMAPHAALRRLRGLEGFGLSFIEQPVPMAARGAMADLTAALDTPIMADEGVFNPVQALEGAQMRMADIFSLKIMKAGGMRAAMDVAAIARAAGIAVYGGCMFETSIAHAAGTHLMAAVPDLTLGCEFYMSTYYAESDIAQRPFDVRGGMVHVPQGPGLGAVPDADLLARYRVAQTEG